jgi:hypothetical protein
LARAKLVVMRGFIRRGFTCGALAALLLQLLLSFGHIHVHGGAPWADPSSGMTTARVAHAWPEMEACQALPAGLADEEEHCIVCFSGFLLSTTSLPHAPPHPASFDLAGTDTPFNSFSGVVIEQRRSPFLARAPPSIG